MDSSPRVHSLQQQFNIEMRVENTKEAAEDIIRKKLKAHPPHICITLTFTGCWWG
jgi:hypothetical protein